MDIPAGLHGLGRRALLFLRHEQRVGRLFLVLGSVLLSGLLLFSCAILAALAWVLSS